MRELTVRIRFTSHSLGNVKRAGSGVFTMPRTPVGAVMFLASWHLSNMRVASQLLSRHQDEVGKILWDVAVDAVVRRDAKYKRYYAAGSSGRQRYVLHEAFVPGQVVGVNCVVPAVISDDDFWDLMRLSGQYKGLSPYSPGEYGRFEVVSIRPRRGTPDPADTDAECEKRPAAGSLLPRPASESDGQSR